MQPRRIAVSAAQTPWPCFKVAMTLPSVLHPPLLPLPLPCARLGEALSWAPRARLYDPTMARRAHWLVFKPYLFIFLVRLLLWFSRLDSNVTPGQHWGVGGGLWRLFTSDRPAFILPFIYFISIKEQGCQLLGGNFPLVCASCYQSCWRAYFETQQATKLQRDGGGGGEESGPLSATLNI